MPIQKFSKNPSLKCWHLPVCQKHRSEKVCIFDDKCHVQHDEAEEKPSIEGVLREKMLDVWCDPTLYDEYIATVKAGNECQLTAHMSLHRNFCCGGLLRGSVVPAKILLVSLDSLPVEDETSNALVVPWSGQRSTLRVTERYTAQTERRLMRLVDTSSLDSRLHDSSKRVFPRHP